MLSPTYLSGVADSVVALYAEVEQELMADIARRIVKTGSITDTAAWQIEKGRQFGFLTTDIQAQLVKAQNLSEDEIDRIFREAVKKGLSFDDKIYKAAGLNPTSISESPALQAVVLQGRDNMNMLMNNFTKTSANNAQASYINLVDKAFIKTISGTTDYTSAMAEAVKELARQGISKVIFPTGSATSIEAAVRRNVLTGINQAVAKLQIARAEDMDCTLVEVTSHGGARPSHAEWQGRIYSIKGRHKHYDDFYKRTGYGTGEGLCGWNCYHNFYPYFEGLSTPTFSKDPSADAGRDNDADYEAQQKMRRYERMVREAKREVATYDAAIEAADSPEIKEAIQKDLERAKKKLNNRQKLLRNYCDTNGLKRDYTRTSVGGYSRKTSSKTVAIFPKSGIIKPARKVNRKDKNIGAFSNLEIPMQKREVLRACRKYNIDTKGITFKIQRSESLLGSDYYGSTDYDNPGRIDLFPNAFIDEEQLVRTVLHEKCHVLQLQKHGKDYVQANLARMERAAYRFEDLFYYRIKKGVQ